MTNIKSRAGEAARRAHPNPQPCEECGQSDPSVLERHHEDYEKPLEIRWLCKPHHAQAHYRLMRPQPSATVQSSGKEGGNFTIYVTGDLYRAVKRLGSRINKSAICSEALAAAVERVERLTH